MKFKTEGIQFSPIKAIQAEAESRGAVSLAQGIPKFLSSLRIRRDAAVAIERGWADFYGPPQGLPELRKRVSEYHLLKEKAFYDPEKEVLVTAGALQGLSVALLTLLSPGDELIVPTPSYFPFLNLPKVLGIKPVYVPLRGENWRLKIRDLRAAISPKTRGILLCHPNNPTGTVYTKEELARILKITSEKNIWVLVDEVYRFFTYNCPYTSLGEFKGDRDHIIRLMSFSKAFSLSGWRIGYLLAEAPVAQEILKVHEMTVTASASLPAQYAALSALKEAPELPRQFAEVLAARRKRMYRRLKKLRNWFDFAYPEGAYYFFVKLRGGQDDIAFSRELLEKAEVAVVPGSTFGPQGKGYLRLSFAAKEGEIDEAFNRLESHLSKPQGVGGLEKLAAEASGVTDDSRAVKKDDIFVAISGSRYDGHDFVKEALEKGASWVVGEQDLQISRYKRVENSREALGKLSAARYGHPSQKLKVIGVTGTDGKTTTAHLLGAILNQAGIPAEVLSTLNAPGVHTTTPPAPVLQKFLARAVQRGKEVAVVEVTSHGIAQERIAGVQFKGAVLTNVTPEHLDYHETFERYIETKARLFKGVDLAVLNADDPSCPIFAGVSSGRQVRYSIKGPKEVADFLAENIDLGDQTSRFRLRSGKEAVDVSLPLPGDYNIQNALAAVAAAVGSAEVPLAVVKTALEQFDPKVLVGRFERVEEITDFSVVIDFAHTPNALAEVLNYAARVKPAGARLLVVFGSAGERDRNKRPEMGRIAARTADFAVLTSEDPRSEDPEKIIDEVARGCFAEGAVEGKNFIRVQSRRMAIRSALEQARMGDFVLVLGKGHEETMAVGGGEHPWSDRRVVKEEFAKILK